MSFLVQTRSITETRPYRSGTKIAGINSHPKHRINNYQLFSYGKAPPTIIN
jgi:hypothetical protein